MRLFVFVFSVFILVSCKGNQKQEALDLSEIIPSSDKYKEGQKAETVEQEVYYFDSLLTLSQLVSDTVGIDRMSVFVTDSILLPDRFISRSKEKWIGKNKNGEQLIGIWTYNDSLEMKNALFNWLDCFGKRCNVLQLFEKKKITAESFLLFALEKKMIYLSSPSSIDAKLTIENLQKTARNERILFVISQGVGKKTDWWEYSNKKWTIKKEME